MTSNLCELSRSSVVPSPMALPSRPSCRTAFTKRKTARSPCGWAVRSSVGICARSNGLNWRNHPDYETNAKRIRNRAALSRSSKSVPSSQARSGLAGCGRRNPRALVRNIQEVVESPHCEARNLFPDARSSNRRAAPRHRNSRELSATPGGPGEPRPGSAHTSDVLQGILGLTIAPSLR